MEKLKYIRPGMMTVDVSCQEMIAASTRVHTTSLSGTLWGGDDNGEHVADARQSHCLWDDDEE